MRHLLPFLLLLPCLLRAQTVGQYEIRKRGTTGMTAYGVTLTNGQVIGQTGGVPAALTPFDGVFSSLSGKPTTLSGYGITDAQPLAAALTTLSAATAAGLALMDDADAAAQRTTLALGAAALLEVSTGGNAGTDLDKLARYQSSGQLAASANMIVYDDDFPADTNKAAYYAHNSVSLPNGGSLYLTLFAPGNSAALTITLPPVSGTLIGTGNLTSITALGTVTTGTWQADDIALAYIAQGGATDGQAMVWDNTAGTWEPGTVSGVSLGDANTWTAAQTVSLSSLGTTPTSGLILVNPTAATSGNQQNAPVLQLTGEGYTTGGGSVTHNWYATVKPTQYTGTLPIGGGLPDLGYLQISGDIDGSMNNVRSGYAGYNDLKLDLHGCLWLNAHSGRQIALGGTPAGGGTNMSLDTSSGIFMAQNHRFGWVTGFNAYSASDFEFARLTTNTLALTDYTTGGTMLAVMLTHTSATSFEAGVIDTITTANTVRIGSAVGSGGGTARDVHLIHGGTVKASLTSSGFVIGSGGSAISKVLTATATLNFDLTALVVEDLTVTCTGAAVGDSVFIGVPNGSVTTSAQFTAWVSAADTVTVRCRTSVVGEDPASGTFRVDVHQH